MDAQLKEHMHQYFDGTIAAAGWESLQARMKDDPAVRQAFIRLSRREALLVELLQEEEMVSISKDRGGNSASSQWIAGLARQDASAPRSHPRRQRRQRSGRRSTISHAPWCCKNTFLATAAACLVIVVGVMWYDRGTAEALPNVVATLIRADRHVDLNRHNQTRPIPAGFELLPNDRLKTSLSAATLRYRLDRAEVELQANTTATLMPSAQDQDSHQSMFLHAGRVGCTISKRLPDDPFVVTTDHARIVVLGTVFQLEADAAQTRLDVIQGRVRMALSSDDAQFRILTAGQSAIATHDSLHLIDTGPSGQTHLAERRPRPSEIEADLPLVINETWDGKAARSRWLVMTPPHAEPVAYTGPGKQPPEGWPVAFVDGAFDGQPAAVVSTIGESRFVLKNKAGSGPLRFMAQPGRLIMEAEWQIDLLPEEWRPTAHDAVYFFSLSGQVESSETLLEEMKQGPEINTTHRTRIDLELQRMDGPNLQGLLTITYFKKQSNEIVGTRRTRILVREGNPLFPNLMVSALTFRIGEVSLHSDLPVLETPAESNPASPTKAP